MTKPGKTKSMGERETEGRDKTAVGARLTLTRQVLGYAQNEFAEGAGLSKNTYNQYETGKNMPELDKAHKLCDKYGLTLDWIYRGDQSGLTYKLADALKSARQVRDR